MNLKKGITDSVIEAVRAVRAIDPMKAAMGVSKSAYDMASNPGGTLAKSFIYNPENKRVLPFLPYGGANIAQDVGTGIRAQQRAPELEQMEKLAASYEAHGEYKNANMIRQQISDNAGDISRSFSDDVGGNPIFRGMEAGGEIGSTAAIVTSGLNMANKAAARYSGEAPKSGGVSAADYKARIGGQGQRPAHQVALEQARARGDNAEVGRILDSIPANDPYKTPMETLFRKDVPNVVDPKQTLLKSQARTAQYNADATGREGFMDLNAKIGGSTNTPIGKTFKSSLSSGREFTPVKIVGDEAIDATGQRVKVDGLLNGPFWKPTGGRGSLSDDLLKQTEKFVGDPAYSQDRVLQQLKRLKAKQPTGGQAVLDKANVDFKEAIKLRDSAKTAIDRSYYDKQAKEIMEYISKRVPTVDTAFGPGANIPLLK